ncbi:Actinorhodin polyketide putative beta-ketoacyl synthase 1 (plasmid) [Apilactobacillus kunkeei]|uniref:beta-ketoacyl-[acyl-carrier-protein] synthase family protein n=1 Tax=Apilactobacillus waqarii TaxID=2851006 RepID=UPI0021E1CAC3|nr:Actinorhodin polyketide putative beta-ketoacyl synthase 1 [Apilactobacillus kunkeei]CAI2672605.1 Actinorhodin polyketide putative beta-ketoacyl synthase 1 [Apilactobacillus kunkeei]CAI2673250.1 Actinorhodin polyketide putative beta-ketoacyl synthase 1 [Apilactobacillus kunkeei]CAI2674984.1 Actinorhodin polyketide putative beta-ketoacyl synthase 1 [Apilactobacillus kunkeei]CAI2675311.1 Actinorhodin polyketide putative beta-ketoacyl synthase 1 [Apilactobacillus kunkeei]
MNKEDNIVITGIGIISPLGDSKEKFWKNEFSGESRFYKSNLMEKNGLKSRFISKIYEFEPDNYLDNDDLSRVKQSSRYSQLALIAANEAIRDSKIMEEEIDLNKVGTIFSSAIGGTPEIQKTYETLTDGGINELRYKNVGVEFYNSGMFNYPATVISSKYNFQGPCFSLSTGCTAGMDAMGEGMQLIQDGELDVAIVGASEAPLSSLTYSTLDSIGALSKWTGDPSGASRPFDRDRCGFVISESSAFLVIEKESHAYKRGANIYCKIKSFSSHNNSLHMTDLKDSNALQHTIKECLIRGNLSINDIDYINAHGSSTQQNDLCESNAIKKIFTDNFHRIPVSSTKSMMGHPLSSASLVAIVSTIGSMKYGTIPPNINLDNVDVNCNLNLPVKKIKMSINNSLIMASGFGGIHSSCILSKVK